MPWDPYFSCYFHLWLTILHLRLTTFDFFEIPASIFLLSGRTACNFAPLWLGAEAQGHGQVQLTQTLSLLKLSSFH